MNSRNLRIELLYLTSALICLSALFHEGFGGKIPAFRDTFHFYYPQYVWLDACANAGEHFPLWNRQEGLGVSTVGQGTTALYYPLRVLFYLPFSLPTRLNFFILAHLAIAAVGIRIAARCLGLSVHASWLAAFSFAFSCPVFFSHTNIIYLTSAAWLGFFAAAVINLLHQTPMNAPRVWQGIPNQLIACAALIFASCMMIAGGDPHTLANASILALLMFLIPAAGQFFVYIRQVVWKQSTPEETKPGTGIWPTLMLCGFRILVLGAAICVAAAITTPIWRPMLVWSELSSRSTNLASIQPTDDSIQREAPTGPQRRSHRVYDFSLSPWHVFTLVFPTIGGSYSNQHSRVFTLLPAEGRMWMPSLFGGTLPLLLVLLAFSKRLRSINRTTATQIRFLQILGLFSLLAAFGNYTCVWAVRELGKGFRLDWLIALLPSDPVTGVYWFLTELIPGYSAFRYPAKWAVFFSLSFSLLAGIGYHSLAGNKAPDLQSNLRVALQNFCKPLHRLCFATLLLLLGILVANSFNMMEWANTYIRKNSADRWLGWATLDSVFWTAAIAVVTPCLSLVLIRRFLIRGWLRCFPMLVLIEMTIVCHCWTCFVAPPQPNRPEEAAPGRRLVWINDSHANILSSMPTNAATSSEEAANYQANWGLGKLELLADTANLSASMTLTPTVIRQLKMRLSRIDNLSEFQPDLDFQLRQLGVTHRLFASPWGLQWHRLGRPEAMCTWTCNQEDAISSIQWNWATNNQLVITGLSNAPGQLVVLQFDDGGWLAAIEEKDATARRDLPMKRTEFGLLSVEVPPGEWILTLRRRF